jgi:hypothetical protein
MNETGLSLFTGENLQSLFKACETLAKTEMIPKALQKKPADIFAILVMSHELGIKPMQGLNSINVIQGKPTISPQLMIAMVKSKIPDAVIKIESKDGLVTCLTARNEKDMKEGLSYLASWGMEKAKKMGLASKDNYTKQPETMFRWRAIAESCRVTFPDVLMGMYAPEEFQDIDGDLIKTQKQAEKELLDSDFPIPQEEKEVGDLYRIQNGKFRSKQLKDISIYDLATYREEILKRTTPKKDWENELVSVIGEYLFRMDNTIEVNP